MAARFLVVEDDVQLAGCFARVLRKFGDVRLAYSLAAGLEALGSCPFTAHIIDLQLPDGSGLGVVTASNESKCVPTMIVTGHALPEDINTAHDLGLGLICKSSGDAARIEHFVKGILARATLRDLLVDLVRRWQAKHHLTPAEAVNLRMVLCDRTPRASLPGLRRVTAGTVDKQVASLLHKLECPTLEALVERALREVKS